MTAAVPNPPERFLNAATRTFGDNAELQVIAHRELDAMLDLSASDAAEKATKRLDAVDQQKHPRLMRYLAGVVAVVSLLIAGWTTWGIYRDWDELRWFDGDWDNKVATEWIRTLPPTDQLILNGDPDAFSPAEGMKKLWESDPDNAVYFAEYARQSLKSSKTLPSDFPKIATRLDPDNGYFLTLQAGDPVSPHCVEQKIPAKPVKPRDPSYVPEWQINDEAKWQASLELLRRASSMPVYKSYSSEITRQRLELLPPPTDVMSYAPRFQYLFVMAADFPDFSLSPIISAKAEDCLKQVDREGLLQLRRDWDRLITASVSDAHPTMMSMMIYRSIARGPLNNFIATAEGLGLAEEAALLRKRREQLLPENSPVRQAIENEAMKRDFAHHAGFLKGDSTSHRLPADEELKPGRLAEYEWFDRLGALAAWIVLALVSFLVWSYRFRAGGPARRIAGRLKDLVTERDRFRIAAAGIGLPLLFVCACTYLTPLAARDWSISVHGGTVCVGQLLSSLFLVLLLPPLIARGILAKRAGWLGLKSGASVGGWIAVAASVVAWALFGVAQLVAGPEGLLKGSEASGFQMGNFFELDPERAHGPGAIWLWTAEGLLALSLLYLLIVAARSVFSKQRHLLRRSILARLILPAYLTGMAALSVAMPLHHAAERYWVARDTLTRMTPANNGLHALEAELALIDRAQLLKALATP
jgi:hypothetical protein